MHLFYCKLTYMFYLILVLYIVNIINYQISKLVWLWRMTQTWCCWHSWSLRNLEVAVGTSFGWFYWSSCSFGVVVVALGSWSSCFGCMSWTSSSLVVTSCYFELELLRLSQLHLLIQFIWCSLKGYPWYRFVRSKQVLASLVHHNHHLSLS